MRRRQLLLSLTAAGALGPGGLPGVIRDVLAAGNQPVTPGMQRITGTVTVNGQPAKEGQTIRPGDQIVTGQKSQAIYVIGQDAYLQRENSNVGFASEAGAGIMRVVSGAILSVFGKGEKRLIVPTAVIGIRGTGCYIEASPKTVYFCLCYGIADVAPNADPRQIARIETTHHDHPVLIHNDSAMPAMADATVVNHTDAELVMLENLVGRWPPFYGKPNVYGY